MTDKKLGVIGGSGLYEMADLDPLDPVTVATPFGAPSDAYLRGTVGEVELFFLPRHGRGHRILPSEINHRANIFGFKKLGVRVVNMSWLNNRSLIESSLEANRVCATAEERSALARRIYRIERDALYEAIRGAPEILFIPAAGNFDNDVDFCRYLTVEVGVGAIP